MPSGVDVGVVAGALVLVVLACGCCVLDDEKSKQEADGQNNNINVARSNNEVTTNEESQTQAKPPSFVDAGYASTFGPSILSSDVSTMSGLQYQRPSWPIEQQDEDVSTVADQFDKPSVDEPFRIGSRLSL